MSDSIKIYMTSDYSVEIDKEAIETIIGDTREELYAMPRPEDYTVIDILNQANYEINTWTEFLMWNAGKDYSLADLDNKERTKSDYWQVIKKVVEEIDVIIK